MADSLPKDRAPAAAEWQACLDALAAAPGPAMAAPAASASPPPDVVLGVADGLPATDAEVIDLSITPEGVPVPAFTPWVPRRSRADGWSAGVQRLFIRALTRIGSARDAAVFAGIDQAKLTAIERALHGQLATGYFGGRGSPLMPRSKVRTKTASNVQTSSTSHAFPG